MSYLDVALKYWKPSPGAGAAWPRTCAPSRAVIRNLRFKKIDAFATSTTPGNPAAAVYLDSLEHLTAAEMQRIAKELKGFVSEVGYVARLSRDAFQLKYFSSEREVAFCGHTTLAIVNELVRTEAGLRDMPEIHLHTRRGVLSAEIPKDEPEVIYIQAPDPVYAGCGIALPEICKALGMPRTAIDGTLQASLVNAGNQTLCLPVKSLRQVLACEPDFDRLRELCARHHLDAIVVFTREVSNPASAYRTRVFVAPLGYLEDPATGSANAALGYCLFRSGAWDGSSIQIEQNADPDHPNLVKLSTRRNADGTVRVVFGGGAILRLEGQYSI